MPAGPGRYDDLCTEVRVKAKAAGALVMVFGGDRGYGFSVQADADTTTRLPEMLEMMAAEIRASLKEGIIEP